MTLVDTNVLIDILLGDPKWQVWSALALQQQSLHGPIVINEIVYAELSGKYTTQSALDDIVDEMELQFEWLPRPALHVAGRTFNSYRRSGGTRNSILPDFFIGSHAVVTECPILTRDTGRYRTHFPNVQLITP